MNWMFSLQHFVLNFVKMFFNLVLHSSFLFLHTLNCSIPMQLQTFGANNSTLYPRVKSCQIMLNEKWCINRSCRMWGVDLQMTVLLGGNPFFQEIKWALYESSLKTLCVQKATGRPQPCFSRILKHGSKCWNLLMM
jgi:hypothetical protein